MNFSESFIVLYNGKFIRVYNKTKIDKVLANKDAAIAELKEQVALLQAEFVPQPGV